MPARLNEADRRAVDALLDSAACAECTQDMQYQQRLAVARRWIELMGALPAEEPASSLVAATLAKVDASPRIVPGSETGTIGARL